MDIGAEWLVDAAGCDPQLLTSVGTLQRLFGRLMRELDLHPIGEPAFHLFPPPGGITGFVVLTESHLACHTYPEHGVITLNLYCCRPRPEWPWREGLAEILGATQVDVRTVTRASALRELASWR